MSLLIFCFWTATVLTFLKIGLKLLKDKALDKSYPNMEELKYKVGLRVPERTIIFETHFN